MEAALIGAFFLAVVVLRIVVEIYARKQVDLMVLCSADEATATVEGCFGSSWSTVDGKGRLNFKPRLRMKAPTLSVNVEAHGPNRAKVTIWPSAWTSKAGMMANSDLMLRKKRKIVKRFGALVADQHASH